MNASPDKHAATWPYDLGFIGGGNMAEAVASFGKTSCRLPASSSPIHPRIVARSWLIWASP
jgi:hypothetical protein